MDERVSMLDNYVLKEKVTNESFQLSIEYLSRLRLIIQGVDTVSEIRSEIFRFVEEFGIPQEVFNCLLSICHEFKEETSAYEACTWVLEFMDNLVKTRELEHQEAKDEINNIQENVIDYFNDPLNDVGIRLQGDFLELTDYLQSKEDVDHLKENMDRAIEYLKHREQVIGRNDVQQDLSTDQIAQSLELQGDQNILDVILNSETTEESSEIEIDSDGFLVVQASLEKEESMDFAKMMVIGLMTSNTDSVLSNLGFDMMITKDEKNKNDFSIRFGDFSNPEQNRFVKDPMVMTKLSNLVQSFQTTSDYSRILSASSPELSLVFQMFEKHILQKEGRAQISVFNDSSDLNFSFGLGEQYEELADSLRTNGAVTTQTPVGSYVCNLTETAPGNNLMILDSTNETMNTLKIEREVALSQGKQYVKQIDSSLKEEGNVDSYILMIAVLLGIVIVLAIIFVFSGK